jgi:hypothetical protein
MCVREKITLSSDLVATLKLFHDVELTVVAAGDPYLSKYNKI